MSVEIIPFLTPLDTNSSISSISTKGLAQRSLLISGAFTVATIVGGIVYSVLLLSGTAMTVVNMIAVISTVAVFFAQLLRELSHLYYNRRFPTSGQGGRLVIISDIVHVASVYDLEDFGPGYVVTTSDGARIFLAGQIVENHDDAGESLGETLHLTLSGSNELIAMRCEGERVRVDRLTFENVQKLGIDPTVGVAVLQEPTGNSA